MPAVTRDAPGDATSGPSTTATSTGTTRNGRRTATSRATARSMYGLRGASCDPVRGLLLHPVSRTASSPARRSSRPACRGVAASTPDRGLRGRRRQDYPRTQPTVSIRARSPCAFPREGQGPGVRAIRAAREGRATKSGRLVPKDHDGRLRRANYRSRRRRRRLRRSYWMLPVDVDARGSSASSAHGDRGAPAACRTRWSHVEDERRSSSATKTPEAVPGPPPDP